MKAELVEEKKEFEPIKIRLVLESEVEVADLFVRLALVSHIVNESLSKNADLSDEVKEFCLEARDDNDMYPCRGLFRVINKNVQLLMMEAQNEES